MDTSSYRRFLFPVDLWRVIKPFISTEDTRVILTGINITLDEGNVATIVATDTKRLIKVVVERASDYLIIGSEDTGTFKFLAVERWEKILTRASDGERCQSVLFEKIDESGHHKFPNWERVFTPYLEEAKKNQYNFTMIDDGVHHSGKMSINLNLMPPVTKHGYYTGYIPEKSGAYFEWIDHHIRGVSVSFIVMTMQRQEIPPITGGIRGTNGRK